MSIVGKGVLTASVVDLLLFVVWGGGGFCSTGESCTVGMGGAAAVVVVEARIFWEMLGPMVVANGAFGDIIDF